MRKLIATAVLFTSCHMTMLDLRADDARKPEREWNVGHWFHDTTNQTTLDIKSVIRPSGNRSIVHIPVPLVVRGSHACVTIPSPLHRFVEQDLVFSRVTVTAGGKRLQLGKDFFARLVVSDQGQPFFCVELNNVPGEVTINTESFVLLPPEQDTLQWQREVSSLQFQTSIPNRPDLPKLQYHAPPKYLQAKVDDWAKSAVKNQSRAPLQGLINAVKYVNSSMTYEATVNSEDPYVGLMDDFRGHCGIYGAALSAVGQQLKQNHGVQLFNAGGYWGGPHVKNGVIAYLQGGEPVFMFADATQPDIGPQGPYAFVVTSIAGWNTFRSSQVPKCPSGKSPPEVPFAVNTMGIRDGQIVEWPPVATKRVDINQISVSPSIQQKIQNDIRRLNAARARVYAGR